jgi:hypothetical protein
MNNANRQIYNKTTFEIKDRLKIAVIAIPIFAKVNPHIGISS